MDDLQGRLVQLIGQWRKTSALGNKAKLIQKILSMMEQSGKIWRAPGVPRELYEEALHNNWLWFMENLANYDINKSTVMYWFNQYLKYEISNLRKKVKPWYPIDENTMGSHDDKDNSFQSNLDRIQRCIDKHQSQLRQRSMRGRTDVSCDRILTALLERVEQAPSSEALSDIFAQLATDWQIDRTAFRRFCSCSCFKLLRTLCPPE